MYKSVEFDYLPERLKKRISAVSPLDKKDKVKILRCRIDGDYNEAECFIKDGNLVGLYWYVGDKVTSTWLNDYDIEFLHSAIQSTRP